MRKKASTYASWLFITGAAVAGSSCEQPPVLCTCGRGDFAAIYTHVEGTGDCGEFKSELLGMNAYSPEKDGVDTGSMADWNRSSVAIGSERMGALIARAALSNVQDPDETHKHYAIGDFPRDPTNEFCAVPQTRTEAEIDLPAIPEIVDDPATADKDESRPAVEATHYKYKWSNMNFLVTPAAIGTQLAADLEVTKNACVAKYKVKAVYPARNCEKLDAANQPTGQPDPDRCFPVAQPDKAIFEGSGISPDFPVDCVEFDPPAPGGSKRFYCMLTKDVPAFK
jgi:hypothetical protein